MMRAAGVSKAAVCPGRANGSTSTQTATDTQTHETAGANVVRRHTSPVLEGPQGEGRHPSIRSGSIQALFKGPALRACRPQPTAGNSFARDLTERVLRRVSTRRPHSGGLKEGRGDIDRFEVTRELKRDKISPNTKISAPQRLQRARARPGPLRESGRLAG